MISPPRDSIPLRRMETKSVLAIPALLTSSCPHLKVWRTLGGIMSPGLYDLLFPQLQSWQGNSSRGAGVDPGSLQKPSPPTMALRLLTLAPLPCQSCLLPCAMTGAQGQQRCTEPVHTRCTWESGKAKDTKPRTRSLPAPSASVGWSRAKLQPLTKPGFWPGA